MSSLCLFSPVDGVLTQSGYPVTGARIERLCKSEWFHNNGPISDYTLTDTEGKFHFDPIFAPWGLPRVLFFFPHEPVISQSLTTTIDKKKYTLWIHAKRNYSIGGELGLPKNADSTSILPSIQLLCELENPEKFYKTYRVRGISEVLFPQHLKNKNLY